MVKPELWINWVGEGTGFIDNLKLKKEIKVCTGSA
jgi:hypothetical protein